MAFDRPTILWDTDGTLVDSEPLHEAALVQALHDLDLSPPADLHRQIVGRDAREVHGWCREHLGLDLDLRAAWLLGTAPGRCRVVEDSTTGARSGLAAGMLTLFWPQSELVTPEGAERMVDLAHLTAVKREKRQT